MHEFLAQRDLTYPVIEQRLLSCGLAEKATPMHTDAEAFVLMFKCRVFADGPRYQIQAQVPPYVENADLEVERVHDLLTRIFADASNVGVLPGSTETVSMNSWPVSLDGCASF